MTIAEAVNDDSFKILYDLYHSVTEGEDPATELANAGSLIGYVQFADVAGRGEPGTGSIDWPAALNTLRAAGYDISSIISRDRESPSVAARSAFLAAAAMPRFRCTRLKHTTKPVDPLRCGAGSTGFASRQGRSRAGLALRRIQRARDR